MHQLCQVMVILLFLPTLLGLNQQNHALPLQIIIISQFYMF